MKIRIVCGCLMLAVTTILYSAVNAETPAPGTPQPFKPDEKKIAKEIAQGYERPPQFEAANVLDAQYLTSTDYTVDSVVHNDGAMNHFNISSRFGSFYPGSQDMFEKRVKEIGALVILEKFTDSKVFLDATAKAGGDVLLAPVNAVKTLVEAVADPEETWNVISGVPGGVMRLFRSVSDKIGAGVKSGRKAIVGDKKEKKSAEEQLADSADVATKYALKHFGYNQSDKVRKWQEYLQIDPYTSNEPLQEKIARIVAIENGVSIGFKFVPGVGGISFVSDANKYYKLAKRLSLYDDPVELAKKAVNQLKAMGVDEETIKAFTTNPSLSPTCQAIILDALKKLEMVEDRTSFVASASGVLSYEGALFYVHSSRQLLTIQEKEKGLKRFIKGIRLPAVLHEKGSIILPMPVDYLTWSRDLDGALTEVKKALPKKSKGAVLEVRVKGRVSALCQRKLAERKIRVVERFNPPVGE
ncbi:MAG: hypothetical protein J0M12_00905 [Deltaproteobacteria bacterium]|nr:hypothetical protein [Deltaproteobacteria bacterium]